MVFQVKKALLVLGAYIYSLLRGKAKTCTAANRILVVHMAKLGDMVCTTPVFRAIKRANSSAVVHVMGNKSNAQVLAGNPDVDTYIPFDGFGQAVRRIRSERYDAAVILGAPDITSVAVTYFAGIPCIITPSVLPTESPLADMWYRLLIRLVHSIERRAGTYAPGEYLKALAPLGITASDTTKYLYYTDSAKKRAEEYLQEIGYVQGQMLIGMTPSAGNKIKEWPADRFAVLAQRIVATHGAHVIVFGGPSDTHEVTEFFESVTDSTRIHNALSLFSIDELKAVIAQLTLFISADTGPIYVAEAFGVPTVDIVGPVDEREQPPISPKNVVIVPPGRERPELSVMNAKWYDYDTARAQAEATPLPLVVQEVDTLIARIFSHDS